MEAVTLLRRFWRNVPHEFATQMRWGWCDRCGRHYARHVGEADLDPAEQAVVSNMRFFGATDAQIAKRLGCATSLVEAVPRRAVSDAA
jgi:hypothetical protein